jgi:soluble lytic murein transglycosylase-like protein
MERLGCTDLLDPYQNVIVGTGFLAEQLIRYGGDMGKALVAYNAGHYKGTITRYATEVMAKAEELRGTTYEAEK